MKIRAKTQILEGFGSVSVIVYIPSVYENSSSDKFYFTKNTLKQAKNAAKDYFKNNKIGGEFYSLDFSI